MPFWSTNFGQDATLKDPKRKHRFTVEFQGINAAQGGALLWYAKTATKPGFTVNAAEHKYLGHTFYYPGNVTWDAVTVTLVDPVDPDVTATFSDIVVAGGYTPPTDANSLGTVSKAKATGALGTVLITQLDGDGNPVESWTLWNAFIMSMKQDDLDYTSDELSTTTVELRFDWARVETLTNSSAVNGSGGNEFFKA